MTEYTIGTKVRITEDCRPWYFKIFGNLTGKPGEIIENAHIINEDGTDVLIDGKVLTTPVIKIGYYRIAGFQCWWEPIILINRCNFCLLREKHDCNGDNPTCLNGTRDIFWCNLPDAGCSLNKEPKCIGFDKCPNVKDFYLQKVHEK